MQGKAEDRTATQRTARSSGPEELKTKIAVRRLVRQEQGKVGLQTGADKSGSEKSSGKLFTLLNHRSPSQKQGVVLEVQPRGTQTQRANRPMRFAVMLLLLAMVMLVKPLLFPILVGLVLGSMLITYMALGPDKISDMVVGAWMRLDAFKPTWAERLRLKAQRVSRRVEALLWRLPGNWQDQVHFPEFERPGVLPTLAGREDPLDRLVREVCRTDP